MENSNSEIASDFVMECLEAEQLGDGMLFAEIWRGLLVHSEITGEWLSWQGHYWETDVINRALAAVETVALRYGQELTRVFKEISEAHSNDEKDRAKSLEKLRDYLNSRVKRLRKSQGRKNCLEFAHTTPGNSGLSQGISWARSSQHVVCPVASRPAGGRSRHSASCALRSSNCSSNAVASTHSGAGPPLKSHRRKYTASETSLPPSPFRS